MFELIAEAAETLRIVRKRLARNFRGFAEADDSGDVFRTGAHAALVVAAVKKLLQASSASDIEGTDAFGAVDFVAGKREQIELELIHIHGNFSGGLHGIGMEVDVGVLGDAADFFERLDGAELVVGVHDGDERGFVTNGTAQIFEVDQAILVDVKISYVYALLFESLAGVEDGFMFHKRSDDVRPRLRTVSGGGSDAENRVIVGFGAAAGEENLLGARADERGHLFAGGLDGSASLLAESVDRRSVAEFAGEVGEHRVEHFRLDGGGGVVIEIDAVHGMLLMMILDMGHAAEVERRSRTARGNEVGK